MLKSLTWPEPIRSLSTSQKILIGIGLALILFLIFGSLTQSNDPNQLNVGLQAQPFAILAILAFGGGLLSFASPCTLPVLTAYFAFAFQSGRKQIAANTLAFMLGLATTFTLFGAVGFALGQVLLRNQQLLVLVGGAVVMVFGVMSLLGQGFGGIDPSGAGTAQPQGANMRGSYLFGLSFAVGWSSCVGPILGAVLTLAAQSSSVFNGMMLLFIYTLGLGLPLLIVSTFFGRMDRKNLFWRLLKGKGWEWNTHLAVVALVWGLAVWRILVALAVYAFRNFDAFGGQQLLTAHQIALFVVALLGSFLWIFTSSEERKTTIHLHSTQLISGGLFIIIAILMLNGTLASINSLVGQYEFAEWFVELEDRFINLFP